MTFDPGMFLMWRMSGLDSVQGELCLNYGCMVVFGFSLLRN